MEENNKEESGVNEGINIKKEIFEWIKIIAAAVVLALIMNTFIIANSTIPSGSMENTIQIGDRVIGFRLSYKFQEPERGDIVIFDHKIRDSDKEKHYVKRIIGLPGDIIDIREGKVYINNSESPLEEPYLKEEMQPENLHFEVPEDSYFMMGDNRNESYDSRYWQYTYIKKNQILAKVLFRYFPKPGLVK